MKCFVTTVLELAVVTMLIACGSRTRVFDGPVDVFVVAGQSNAVGGAHVSQLSSGLASFADPYPAVQLAEQLNCPQGGVDGACGIVSTWRPLAPRAGGNFGVELSLGRSLDLTVGNVAIIKTATTGAGLGAQWEPDATPGRWQWDYMRSFIDARLVELEDPRIAGLVWVGCESDAASFQLARAVDDELAYFALRFRQTYGPTVVVAVTELSATLINADDVRERQHRAAAHVDAMGVVGTSDLVFRDGVQHYDADSFVILGDRIVGDL